MTPRLACALSSTFTVLALTGALVGCTPQVPRTADELKASLTEVGETTQSIVEKAPEVAESTRDTLERVGETTQAAATATKEGLEAVGNTVLSITSPAPAPGTAPAEQR